jgi:predicted DNA-binding transcriptional regulator AlpA
MRDYKKQVEQREYGQADTGVHLISRREARARLGIGSTLLAQLAKAGDLGPIIRLGSRRVAYRSDAIDAYIARLSSDGRC